MVSSQLYALFALPQETLRIRTELEVGWDPEPAWMFLEKRKKSLDLLEIRNQFLPVTLPTTLFLLLTFN
jgi:hypothetical protein